jgi:hypothetical protein
MKLSELIQEYEFTLSANAEAALRSADWNYDVDPFDGRRFNRGQQKMNEVQSAVKELYAKSPEEAEDLWSKHCPYANGHLPTWVLA